MTEKLRALLDERATAHDFALPDLDVVRAAGLHRRRRARGGVTAGLVATAAATALVVALLPGGGDARPDAADDPTPSGERLAPSWAIGSVIHLGDDTIDVGHDVWAYVRTSEGFAAVDDTGTVRSVSAGVVEEIGTTDPDFTELASDPGSSKVAWLADGAESRVVVHDQADGTSTAYDVTPDRTYFHFFIEGDVLYVRDVSSAIAIDLGTGTTRVVDPEADEESFLVDAAGGRLAFSSVVDDEPVVALGPTRAQTGTPFELYPFGAILSPDAAYIAEEDDKGAVVDTETGTVVDLDLTGFYEPYEWWDATTLAIITETSPGSGRARLASCDVVSGTCRTEVDDLGAFDELEDFSLPVGER